MFYTLTIDGLDQLLEAHESLADASAFAREVAGEGYYCAVLQVLSVARKEYVPSIPLEKLYRVVPGVDFPATLARGRYEQRRAAIHTRRYPGRHHAGYGPGGRSPDDYEQVALKPGEDINEDRTDAAAKVHKRAASPSCFFS